MMIPLPHQNRLTANPRESLDSGIVVDEAQNGEIRSRRLFDAPKAELAIEWSNLKGDIYQDLIDFWEANKDETSLTVTVLGLDYVGQIINRPQRRFAGAIVASVTARFVGKLA